MKYTNINRIFAKLKRDFDFLTLNEADIIEWVAEALGAINAFPMLQKAVKMFNVKNHQCKLPVDLIDIIQVVKYLKNHEADCICPQQIYTEIKSEPNFKKSTFVTGCEIPTKQACEDVILIFEHDDLWYGSSFYQNKFALVRLATNNFATGVGCDEPNPYSNYCGDEYSIIEGDTLRFNFKEGYVAIAYSKLFTDEEGFPMLPDTYAYTEAISKFILFKYFQREFFMGREGAAQKYQKAEMDWKAYCSQAASETMMPKGIDEMQNLAEMWLKPIRGRSYYNYNATVSREQKLKH